MALLIRIAQTQAGAEKLLETRLIYVLSQCDFIETRPEADQSFLGRIKVGLSPVDQTC
jgi:nuclear pore complex protein Nup205